MGLRNGGGTQDRGEREEGGHANERGNERRGKGA